MTMNRTFSFNLLALVALLPAPRLSADVYTVSVPDYQANPGVGAPGSVTLDNAAGLGPGPPPAQLRSASPHPGEVSAGALGAQFDLSHAAVGGVVTMDLCEPRPSGQGLGRLAMLEFRVNPGATTDLYSDLAIARFDLGDATGVRNIAAGQTPPDPQRFGQGERLRNIDNESNGLPDWWELQHNLDLFSHAARQDSDGDSVSDFLEYAFGGHPLIPDDDQVAPVGSVQEYDGHRYLVVTFRRLKDAVNLNYVLQESEICRPGNRATPTRGSCPRRSTLATAWSP